MPEYRPFTPGPATIKYTADCANATPRRVFLPQLPANTVLGPNVAGAPGSRLYTGGGHELAPLDVQIECGWQGVSFAVDQAEAAVIAPIAAALSDAAEKMGLDHGILGLIAKALGVQPWVLLVLIFVGLYGWLVSMRVLPSPIKALT